MFGVDELDKKISTLKKQKIQIENDILKKTKKKQNLERFYGLLYAQNAQLENSVKDAFTILGFDEIKRIRNENEEDWLIDFKTIKNRGRRRLGKTMFCWRQIPQKD